DSMCISDFRAHVFSMLILVALDISASGAQAASCEDLRSTALTNGAVLSAVVVAAGDPSTPGDGPDGGTAALMSVPQKDLPAFCRIAATLKPSADSDIKIEIWLPAAGWNGKF